ncbi:MAG: M28 family peptidase [Planctomycetota bacterium]|nr:M28 family peptidase [Planctomycetota bacterium]
MLFNIIQRVAVLPSETDHEDLVRTFLIDELAKSGISTEADDAGNLWAKRGRLVFCAHMDKLGPPGKWIRQAETIQGRLDDAVGVGVVTALLKSDESVSALFTIGEEWSESRQSFAYGATRAVRALRDLDPSLLIVIDTSPLCNPSRGPILYTASGDTKFDPQLVARIRSIAERMNIPLQVTEGRGNDSSIFGRNNIPTVALEVHVDNYHSASELAVIRDIELLYELCTEIVKAFQTGHAEAE